MGAEEGLELAEKLVLEATGEYLNDLKREIFRGAWEGQTYEEIAGLVGYNESYIKEEGANLCKLLSSVLSERVTKTNFRAALERRSRLLPTHSIAPAEQAPPQPAPASHAGATTDASDLQNLEAQFVGREQAIADLNALAEQGAKIILIQGAGGLGKTTLARRYFKTQGFDFHLELWMATETRNITPAESVVEEWLRRDFNEEPGRDFGVNLERLRRKLRESTQKIGVLIDNLEPALDKQGNFIPSRRPYVDLLRVLADPAVQSITVITSRERLCESSVSVQLYPLEGLNEAAWRLYFSNRTIQPTAALSEMCRAYGGNAKAMRILSGTVLTDFEGNLTAYWQENSQDLLIERELENLVASQFNRLRQINLEAYQLLCRLGCYRYQDVPFISVEGVVCLLWDVAESQRRRVIKSLQDRSLIEVRKGKYWLHPVIRVEAIGRLRDSQDWQTVHRQAAAFWTASVECIATVEDAFKAFEAYYHYIEIQAFEQAGEVLLQKRTFKSLGRERLGRSFYKLGLFKQIISAITLVVDNIQSPYHLSGLYSMLGVCYRVVGNIHQAIACHEKSRQFALVYLQQPVKAEDKAIQTKLKQWQLNSLLNIGICQIHLWDLESALAIFQQLAVCPDSYRVLVSVFLAFIHSCLDERKPALNLVETSASEIGENQLLGDAYKLLYLGLAYKNLGETEKAFETYRRAISFADESDYTPIKGKALDGLAELYREQQAFDAAFTHHREAIELLDQVGAKCDLAEAYFQLALTYQASGKVAESQAYRDRAIQLFEAMQAPKQVERVRLQLTSRSPEKPHANY